VAKNTPAFQFYPTDFLGGVGLLSDEATGIYIKILSALWVQGNLLPVCFHKLARVALTDASTLERIWPEIEGKFVIKNGQLSHSRFASIMEISSKRRESGSKGGKQKAKQTRSKTSSKKGSKTLANCRSMKTEERSMKTEEENQSTEALLSALPAALRNPRIEQAVEQWSKTRSEGDGDHKRAIGLDPMTLQLQLSKLGDIGEEDVFAAIADAAAGGWKTLHPPRRERSRSGGGSQTFHEKKTNNTLSAAQRFASSDATEKSKAIEGRVAR
jgi:uncharacterized protein YdaU (DUF1376 family)